MPSRGIERKKIIKVALIQSRINSTYRVRKNHSVPDVGEVSHVPRLSQITSKPTVTRELIPQNKGLDNGQNHTTEDANSRETQLHRFESIIASDHAQLHFGDSHATVFNFFFENSPSYRAWSYTSHIQIPTLYAFLSREVTFTPAERVTQICFLFAKNPGHQIQINVSLIIRPDSDMWLIRDPRRYKRAYIAALPTSVTASIFDILKNDENLADDCHVKMVAGKTEESLTPRQHPCEEVESHISQELRDNLERISCSIPHWACPWYKVNGLDRYLLYEGRQSNHFLVRLPDQWALETRFSIDIRNEEYSLTILRKVTQCTSIAAFKGVVRDDKGLIIAFLSEIPCYGQISVVIAAAKKDLGSPVSSERRLKWCRQLVEAVASVHDAGFVVGVLGRHRAPPLALDRYDNLKLYGGFCKGLEYRKGSVGNLPPECRNFENDMLATQETDLYQLGHILWRIASGCTESARVAFCRAVDCDVGLRGRCSRPHTDPAELPMTTSDFPEYLREIISSCRKANPIARLPAQDLIIKFPEVAKPEIGYENAINRFSESTEPSAYQRLFHLDFHCNYCGAVCTHHGFRCSICEDSNFDLCPRCFQFYGRHCLDDQHLMRETGGDVLEDKFWTSIGANRKRREVTLSNLGLCKL